jgi:hypothetical protein
MALKTRKVQNVSAQRAEVQRVIAAATATDAALAASEQALDALDSVLSGYSK